MEEHFKNLNEFQNLENIKKVLDAGSGKTSLSYLINKFSNATIDAIVYPGDERKIGTIREKVKGNYNLMELDFCKEEILKSYDFVLAHLLLGEATKFGNHFQDLLHKLLKIKSPYFLIYDILEDTSIDYNYLEKCFSLNNFEILEKKIFKKSKEQAYGDFIAKNYVAYLIKKTD